MVQAATGRRLARSGLVRAAARAGYAAKGFVYVLIGGLAVTAATGRRAHVGGGETVVREIGHQPYGKVLLVLAAAGLFAYAFWRAAQVIFDPEHKGALTRSAYALSGVVHAALAVLALQIAFGSGSGGGHSEQTIVASLLRVEGGVWIVGAMGAVVILYAAKQIHTAWTSDFMRELSIEEMNRTERRAAFWIGRVGLMARAIVFIVVGLGIIRAAMNYSPSEAGGIGGALSELASKPFGVTLLLLVAVGLCAYGIYQFVLARYRRIPGAP